MKITITLEKITQECEVMLPGGGRIIVSGSGTVVTNPQRYLTTEEVQCIRDDRFIEAIKMVRERTGLGLKDAKDLATEYRDVVTPGWHQKYNQ